MTDGQPRRGTWQGFTMDADPDRVRVLFEKRHGYPPAKVIRAGCILLAGPIGGNGAEVEQLSEVTK